MKVIKIDNVINDLYEWFELTETPHFNPRSHLKKHFNRHVLKKDEKFDPDDPKYPYGMTIEEYEKAAEELADEPATAMWDVDNADGVVGWVVHHGNDRTNRIVKIRKHSKFVPGFYDVVMYVDNKNDNQIFSFMCGKPSNMGNWARDYQYDLYSQGGPDPLYEKKYMDDKEYKGYIISKNGTRDYPYNVYRPKPLPNFPNNKIHVGFGRTIKSCKEDIDGGWFNDVDRDI